MNETHWSPRVARALHEFADATPLPPSIDGDSGVRRQRPQRKMALSIATAALLVVGAGGTAALLFRDASRSQSELPSSPIEPTVPAEPSIFDSGTSLIVWVHWEATPEQVQYIRNAILATGAVTPAELKYLDTAAMLAEAERIWANDPAVLADFSDSSIQTAFQLFPADPAFDPEQWRNEFEALPLVLYVAAPTDYPIEMVAADPSIFDSGTSLIVWVHWEATPEQVQYIRNAILATGAVTPAELKYLDAAATFAEAQRIFADDPATLAYFKSHISTSFRLFPADPAFDPEQWRSEFAALPLVVDVAAPTDEPIAMVPADNVATEGSSAPETTAGEAPPETTAGEAP